MSYKFKVGRESVAEVLKEIKKLGREQDLSDSLRRQNAGTSIDGNGELSQTDPDLQTFSATDDLEIDSTTLETIQEFVKQNGLDNSSSLLKKVTRANPPNCVPPYDCGNTILN